MEEELIEDEEVELKKPKEISVLIGEYLCQLWKDWKAPIGETAQCIGELLGFNLYIERTTRNVDEIRSLEGSNILFSNKLYVRHKDSGLKYVFNHGVPSRDNFKLASRVFLNSLDRIENQLKQFTEEQERLDRDINHYSTMEVKEFSREAEIMELRESSKNLDREISSKITGKIHSKETVEV